MSPVVDRFPASEARVALRPSRSRHGSPACLWRYRARTATTRPVPAPPSLAALPYDRRAAGRSRGRFAAVTLNQPAN